MTVLLGLDARLKMARLTVTIDMQRAPGGRGVEMVQQVFEAGADIVVVKVPDLPSATALEQLQRMRRFSYETQGLLAVLGDVDLASEFHADVFHLTTSGNGAAAARERLHPWALIGACSHNVEEAKTALKNADVAYLWAGPAFTASREVGGLADINVLTKLAPPHLPTSKPWFAAGGITVDNLDDVLHSGARRITVGNAVCTAENPGEFTAQLARRMRQAWNDDPQMEAYLGSIFQEPSATEFRT